MQYNDVDLETMKDSFVLKDRSSLTELRWFDVLVVTVIMFGSAIWSSTGKLVAMGSGAVTEALSQTLDEALEVIPVFSPVDDLFAIVQELFLLLLVFLYLKWRHFDFSLWKIRPSFRGTGFGILLFCFSGLMFDLLNLAVYGYGSFSENLGYHQIVPVLLDSTMILFLFSLLNGFFEEIFFLGVCTQVNPRYRNWYLVYSILVRISFHTYQGVVSSLGIGVMLGLLYYFVWRRTRDGNLYPVMIAHAGADLIGLTFLSLF